jgi:transcriptional regulator GlxA family with amidase domain
MPGSEAVLSRLAETMITQALRVQLTTDPARTEALRDPQISEAIRLIHQRPDKEWTVERLASEVGYSRSAFSSHFRETVGEPPIAYPTRSRLAIGATLLDRTTMSIAEVARRTGYANDASFGRAFKRGLGVSPGEYRRGDVRHPVSIPS